MKKIITLTTVVLIALLASEPVKSIKSSTCPSGSGPCVCDGKCYDTCGDCPNPADCTCNNKIIPFHGKTMILYVLPKGTLFTCASSDDASKEVIEPTQVGAYMVCLPAPSQTQKKSHPKRKSFKTQPGTIYSFSQGTSFVCESNQLPEKITAPVSVEGQPSVYWSCSVASSSESPAKP